MTDLVFNAAATITTAPAGDNDASGNNAPKQRHGFGAIPYERVLSIAECKKLEKTASKLQRLGPFVHVWVRDARSFRHGKESDVLAFSLRLHPSVPVAEIRDMIQEKFAELSSYKEESEGCLSLLFEGRVLENDTQFAEYLVPRSESSGSGGDSRESKGKSSSLAALFQGSQSMKHSWAKPFAGIIWVIPFRPMRTTSIDWVAKKSSYYI